ncbi:PhzF family phenazine biosynthesis protein [soil metagenome]
MSNSVEVEVVRVFTDAKGAFGNELGIVPASAVPDGHEQDLAARLGFSETVFIGDLSGGRATIRIFTPARELPFAGHPSVGTAWWLGQLGMPIDTLVESAGDVAVRFDDETTWIAGRAEWAPEFEWFALPSPDNVDRLVAREFGTGSNYAYAWIDESAGILRSRMFAPAMGITEDEATGAAAVAITTKLDRDLTIHQGKGSVIVTRRGEDGIVEVGGETIWDRRIELEVG